MTELKRFELNYESAFQYFQYSLSGTNKLSSTLVESLNFSSGKFFTLLPTNSKLHRIYEFRYGGIGGVGKDQLSSLILNELHLNNKLSCIFDDTTTTFNLNYNDSLFQLYGLLYDNEIYYLITQEKASLELIKDCLYASDAIWHSLCVLSEIDFSKKYQKELSLKEITDICLKTKLIIISAYDGEGYIFWEP